MIGKICGTGSSIPVKIMDNDDLSNMVDTNDAWIRERTGVEKRHIAESESTVSMAVEAGRQALAQTGIRPEELDMIVVSTMSPDACFLVQPAKCKRLSAQKVRSVLICRQHVQDLYLRIIQRRRTFRVICAEQYY